jgi:D-tyrosyl-tRNA(Tyr) deacylase
MRILVQRVNAAECRVDGALTGAIGHGLIAYVGFTHDDTEDILRKLARKLVRLRIFDDQNGVMNESVLDQGGSILSISQFTLYGDASKGNRPSYTNAMEPAVASRLYDRFNDILRDDHGVDVQTGIFGAHMVITQENDGPVTILLEQGGGFL